MMILVIGWLAWYYSNPSNKRHLHTLFVLQNVDCPMINLKALVTAGHPAMQHSYTVFNRQIWKNFDSELTSMHLTLKPRVTAGILKQDTMCKVDHSKIAMAFLSPVMRLVSTDARCRPL